jgi:hypothetical protein
MRVASILRENNTRIGTVPDLGVALSQVRFTPGERKSAEAGSKSERCLKAVA